VGCIVLREATFPIGLLEGGADTPHTALRTGWTLDGLAGLALVRIARRHAVAACWLFPPPGAQPRGLGRPQPAGRLGDPGVNVPT
jgi:hypothetical protein